MPNHDCMTSLATALDAAAECYEHGNPLIAYAQVAVGLNEFARTLNAPPAVTRMLADMLGDFANLNEGRPAANLKAKRVKSAPRQPIQHLPLWAAASVFVDYMPDKKAAFIEAERRLTAAGCPLPRNNTHATSRPGASLEGWRKQRRSRRLLPAFDRAVAGWAADIDRLVRVGMSREEAASRLLDEAITLHYQARK
ncbi:hypothetical protein [Neoaquamicrobium sediminum]|uniref:hypothetical protein n=1 Tax=Neoaquamicrobium sediminum TaxID=1849104 RepID=UPI0015659BBF|nr:hypothetical protein [Mesorhizobium sediminum]